MNSEMRPPIVSIEFQLANGIRQIETPRLSRALVVVSKAGHDMFDVFANAIIVRPQSPPVNPRSIAENGFRQSRNDCRFTQEFFRGRRQTPLPALDYSHRVLGSHDLRTALL